MIQEWSYHVTSNSCNPDINIDVKRMLEIRKHAFRCDDTRRGDVYKPFLLHRQGGGLQCLHFDMLITS